MTRSPRVILEEGLLLAFFFEENFETSSHRLAVNANLVQWNRSLPRPTFEAIEL